MRKPSPHDINGIVGAETFPDMMKNNLFRAILVAALANIGSIAGTFIGAYLVWTQCGIDIDVIRAGITGALGI